MTDDIRSELHRAGAAPSPPAREGFVVDLERRLRGLPRPPANGHGEPLRPSLLVSLGPLLIALVMLIVLVVVLVVAAAG